MKEANYVWAPEYWRKWIASPIPAREHQMLRQAEILSAVTSGTRADRILDAGCGYGRFTEFLLNKFPAAEVIGCDISPEMVKTCYHSFQSQKRFTPKVASLSSLPFKDGVFDLAICMGVLMHVLNEKRSLQELCRVVKPGGSLLFSYDNLFSPYSIPTIMHNKLVKHGVPKQAFRTPLYFLSTLQKSSMQVIRTFTDSILCVDLSPSFLSQRGIYFIPRWALSILDPFDRLLSASPLKYLGFEVYIFAQKV